jgi:putative membrane protein
MRFGPFGQGAGNGHPFLGLLFFLVVVALVVWALLIVSRHLRDHHSHHADPATASIPTSDALKILNERFARGEIDAEEFTKRRNLLQGP